LARETELLHRDRDDGKGALIRGIRGRVYPDYRGYDLLGDFVFEKRMTDEDVLGSVVRDLDLWT
jgi:hypothetical protein